VARDEGAFAELTDFLDRVPAIDRVVLRLPPPVADRSRWNTDDEDDDEGDEGEPDEDAAG